MQVKIDKVEIKIDKGIPVEYTGRPKKYEKYLSTIDAMEDGDSIEVYDMRTWDAIRRYQYTDNFQFINGDAKIVTKRYTGNKYRIWKIIES
jgi:hypothetical protein